MKLYTEKELIKAYMDGNIDGFNHLSSLEMCLKALTPIELPSDEEIRFKSHDFIVHFRKETFFDGAKWMKEQILNQNK